MLIGFSAKHGFPFNLLPSVLVSTWQLFSLRVVGLLRTAKALAGRMRNGIKNRKQIVLNVMVVSEINSHRGMFMWLQCGPCLGESAQ